MVILPDMPTPPAPPCTWQKKRTAPGTRNVTVEDQAALLGLPLPPTPSQPLAHRNDVMEPGSDITLWKPPLLWNVTVSLTAMVSVFGEKVMVEFAVTVWPAAETAV